MTDPSSLRPHGPGRRSLLRAALLLAAVTPLAACVAPEDDLAKQAREGNGKNYISGDSSVQEYPLDKRGERVEFSSTTFDGKKVDTADWAGRVVVMNFWYAACPPCRIEAPDMAELSREFADDVDFLGVNVRDEKAAAEAFEATFKIPYPSIQDNDAEIQLAMMKYVPLQAVPTTLVIDKQGRVAARILGVAEKPTLKALIVSRIAEPA